MVDTGIIFSNLKYLSLSRMLNGILTLDQQWLPNRSDVHQFHDFYTELDLHWITGGFHRSFALVWHASRVRLLFRSHGSVPFLGLAYLQLLRPVSRTCRVFFDFSPWILLGNPRCINKDVKYRVWRDLTRPVLFTFGHLWLKNGPSIFFHISKNIAVYKGKIEVPRDVRN